MHFIFSQDIKDHKMSRISESRIGFQAEIKVQQREKTALSSRYYHGDYTRIKVPIFT